MVLPLGLLRCAEGHPMLVELKNGETFNGHLVACDNYMNLTLREVILTAPDGDRFWRLPECYVKGANIKYVRVPDQIIDLAKMSIPKKKVQRRDDNNNNRNNNNNNNGNSNFNRNTSSSNRGRTN